ncbi:hypothetical protein C8J56DRAFT_406959 [Mycena floridula]|nr:hypothetical protein C8J56DRAFT_406959 [Mycena floridula]
MGLRTSKKRSAADVLQERLQNSVFKELHSRDLDTFHYKRIMRPTKRHHDLIKKHYKLYADEKGNIHPGDIVIGTPWPGQAYVKGFALYLCLSIAGRSSPFVRRATIKSYMTTFLALWARYSGIVVPPTDRLQIWAFVGSEEVLNTIPLSTAVRATKAIEPACLRLICEATFSCLKVFRTNRMRTQLSFLIPFSTWSTGRGHFLLWIQPSP